MTNDLRERVARAIARAGIEDRGCVAKADEAIAIVIEEVAKRTEDMTAYWHPEVGYEIATAIRAMKGPTA